MNLRQLTLIVAVSLTAVPVWATSKSTPIRGYVRDVPLESLAAREARHRRVAERRAGTIVICHRGASAFAPENTLEAYAAAMDYGADGCEIDVRRASDGVLVLFHDDMLDRLTDGFGTVNQITYYELLSLTPRFIYGTAKKDTRPPHCWLSRSSGRCFFTSTSKNLTSKTTSPNCWTPPTHGTTSLP